MNLYFTTECYNTQNHSRHWRELFLTGSWVAK